jgi:putative ABC transport system permease protein
MFGHNLLLIYRGFLRFKSTFIINIIGLSTALASAILIYLWVNDELTFDRYHDKVDRVFQVMENRQQEGTIKTSGQTADFLSAALAEELPEVEYAAVVTPPNFFPSFTLSTADRPVKGIVKFADKDFFKIFSYKLIQGNSAQVLTNNTSIVISESLAKNLFTTSENSIGKSIEWQMMDIKKLVTVSGVFSDVSGNSSEKFDFVLPFSSFRDLMGMQNSEINWDNTAPFFSYVRVREDVDIDQLNNKMGAFLKLKSKTSQHRTLFLKPYADNYLYGQYENGKQAGGRIEYVILFSTIALFVLLIACINFMNLSTAQALRKVKETGIKRVIGAQKSTLVYQYLEEAFVITLLSVLVAILIVTLLLPQFNEITGKNLELAFNMKMLIGLSILILVTTLLSGCYPAFYLSNFNPARVLKGQFNSSFGELWARKGLVVFQFTLSVIFIVSVLVVYKQIEFIQTKSLGYDKENVIYFEVEGKVSQNSETFISEIKKIPGVLHVSGILGNIVSKSDGGGSPGSVEWGGKTITMNNSLVNYGLLELLGMEMKEGRTFSKDFSSDMDKVIYNEAAIEALGIDNPVGKVIGDKEILGVVKNFHYQSLHELVKPLSFRLEPQSTTTIMVKVQPGTEKQTIDKLQSFYTSYNPGFVFNYEFLDKDYQAQYLGEKRVAVLSQYAACLTILISCLGLFGLFAFTTERRGKEIGIRKVLGSSEFGVVFLLSNDFTKMVIVSIFIALPVSYFISTYWLDNFAYRIELEWWYFLSAAGITLLISWLTIGAQTIKAAKTNPVTMLRSE